MADHTPASDSSAIYSAQTRHGDESWRFCDECGEYKDECACQLKDDTLDK